MIFFFKAIKTNCIINAQYCSEIILIKCKYIDYMICINALMIWESPLTLWSPLFLTHGRCLCFTHTCITPAHTLLSSERRVRACLVVAGDNNKSHASACLMKLWSLRSGSHEDISNYSHCQDAWRSTDGYSKLTSTSKTTQWWLNK